MPVRINSVIDKALTDWITSQVSSKYGATVIWSKQTAEGSLFGTRVESPFVVLSILNIHELQGSTNEMPTDELGVFNYSWVTEFTLQLNIFTQDKHLEIAEWIKGSLKMPTVQESLRSAGLSVMEYMPTNDLSAILNDKYELRSQFDIRFNYIMEREDNPSEITKVHIEGEIDNLEVNISLDKESN